MRFIILTIFMIITILSNTCVAKYKNLVQYSPDLNHIDTQISPEYRKIRSKILAKQASKLLSKINLDQNLLITVNTNKQQLNLYSSTGILLSSYTISTSRNGLGEILGSYKTPGGLHKIVEKIGENVPKYGIFKHRQFTKKLWHKNTKSGNKDFIVTRILRLQGLEIGTNNGKNNRQQIVDSFYRGIYIHGTTQENCIGMPVTIGCVHLNNQDIIELFNSVPVGSLVFIY